MLEILQSRLHPSKLVVKLHLQESLGKTMKREEREIVILRASLLKDKGGIPS